MEILKIPFAKIIKMRKEGKTFTIHFAKRIKNGLKSQIFHYSFCKNSKNDKGGKTETEINTFLETITNLEAFDLKMKEASEHGGHANKSLLQHHQKGTISGNHTQKESLHLTNQTFSVENSAM